MDNTDMCNPQGDIIIMFHNENYPREMSQPMYLCIYVKMYTCISVFTCAHIASDRTNDNTENK